MPRYSFCYRKLKQNMNFLSTHRPDENAKLTLASTRKLNYVRVFVNSHNVLQILQIIKNASIRSMKPKTHANHMTTQMCEKQTKNDLDCTSLLKQYHAYFIVVAT